jgi:multimeric flavodoxin WrbA
MSHPAVSVGVAYHSRSGPTQVPAEAVARAVVLEGATERLIAVERITDRDWAFLDDATAVIFGSPTFMGTASAAFHTFAQCTSGRWVERRWQDKIAAGFTNSACKAGDKSSTLDYFAVLAAQHGMTWVNLGVLPGWHTVGSSENELNRLGYSNGAAAATDPGGGIDAVHPADVATAAELGRRVVRQSAIFVAGRRALAPVTSAAAT